MKLHRNIALGIVSGLENTLIKKRPAADVIKKLLKSNSNWGSRDRKSIAKIFYDIIRQKRLLEAVLGIENQQIENTFHQLIGGWMVLNDHNLPQWSEFETIDVNQVKEKTKSLYKQRKYRHSLPDWLDQMGIQAFGENFWGKEINALDQPAQLVVRANQLMTSAAQLKGILKKKYQIKTELLAQYPNALVFEKHQSLKDIKEYRQGYFEVQDANSQAIAPYLKPESGKYYIDACAGAGGKSLHLASLTKDKANIMALDIFGSKLDELRKRAHRNQMESIQTTCVKEIKVLHSLKGDADGVLIDAPCSGLGVLKRNPDAKWLMNPERINEIVKTQEKILKTYSQLVKKRGILVYATCSFLPQENSQQVQKFLNSEHGAAFELEQEQSYFSHQTGFDSFYCARLVKKCE